MCDHSRHGSLALPGFLPRGVREAMGKRLNTRGRPTGTVGTQRHIRPSFPRPSGAPCSVQPVTDPSRDSSRLEPPPKPVPTPHGHDWHCCPTPATSCHSASSAACLWGEGRGDPDLGPRDSGPYRDVVVAVTQWLRPLLLLARPCDWLLLVPARSPRPHTCLCQLTPPPHGGRDALTAPPAVRASAPAVRRGPRLGPCGDSRSLPAWTSVAAGREPDPAFPLFFVSNESQHSMLLDATSGRTAQRSDVYVPYEATPRTSRTRLARRTVITSPTAFPGLDPTSPRPLRDHRLVLLHRLPPSPRPPTAPIRQSPARSPYL